MTTLWLLIFFQFSFPEGEQSDVVTMKAWKHPYPFGSQQACEAMLAESLRLSPREIFTAECIDIAVSR